MNTTFVHKDDHGSLFVNDKKSTDQQPDRTGTAVVGGVTYRVSGWIKKNSKGEPFMSLAFTPKTDAAPTRPRLSPASTGSAGSHHPAARGRRRRTGQRDQGERSK